MNENRDTDAEAASGGSGWAGGSIGRTAVSWTVVAGCCADMATPQITSSAKALAERRHDFIGGW